MAELRYFPGFPTVNVPTNGCVVNVARHYETLINLRIFELWQDGPKCS